MIMVTRTGSDGKAVEDVAMTDVDAPWQWPESVWRAHATRVEGGPPLRPGAWPGDARVAVALSFDSDHETSFLRDGVVSPGELSRGQFGSRVGTPRVLALLADHSIRSTFFVPAVTALLHPAEVRDCVEQGHEIAMHGWIHERNLLLEPAEELDLARRAFEALADVSGTAPVGIRTPSWDFGVGTLAAIRELGLSYDSSLMADDDPYEIIDQGVPTGIIELPVEWIRDDAPYFNMDRYSGLRPYIAPADVLQIWRDEFDAARAAGGIFQLTMHPHVIGHRSRLVILEQLIDHIDAAGPAWYATHAEVATHVRSAR
jgi:peptidoglycan/xylan/chitin deacetylase (PgdA/CDA1 family)